MINLKQVEEFFSTTGKWWGQVEKQITDDDYIRLKLIQKLAPKNTKRILELGSSYGNTAAVCAQNGYDVVGIELSDRIDFAREYEQKKYQGSLQFIKKDFYQFITHQPFDLVCYWNGFGIGTDQDLRNLLKKIHHDWLKNDGCALIDIQNPFYWVRHLKGKEETLAQSGAGIPDNVREVVIFDPIKNHFTDTWWLTEKPEEKFTQVMRCFAPADFKLLVAGTGLTIDAIDNFQPTAHQYTIKLVKH